LYVAKLPTGTVAFLFTDIEGSTRRWEQEPEAMGRALARHDEILDAAISNCGGVVFSRMGDGVAAAFASPVAGLEAAVAAQRALAAAAWDSSGPLRVRMGLHTGEGVLVNGQYLNQPLNRCARLMAVGHGGQVLLSSATTELTSDRLPPGCELIDLGEHHLRDLARPMHVFQLVVSDLPRDFPRLRSLDAFATNLPIQATTFIGREDEVNVVTGLLGRSPLVTLTGVGGVGKTRLALQVGAELLARMRDGVFVVELGAVADPNVVAEVVAGVLGVRLGQGQPAIDALLQDLVSREQILVLDNCEHLVVAVAELVARVTRTCPGVKILATSREALNVPGEQVVSVASLGLPTGEEPLQVESADAVRLLVDRARATRADFTTTTENAAALAQICRRLDGIPLALELAAARLRWMSPAEVAARLDQRFRLLTGGSRGAASRQQTLRRTIDWSYDLLDDAERLVLQRAAVFAGGFDLKAAEAACASDDIDALDVVDVLARLADKSLLLAEADGAATRYRMLETIREYGLERLEHDQDVAEVRRAHAAHFVAFANEAGLGLRGRDEREWASRVEREIENLRLAVIWSVEARRTEIACDIIVPLALEMSRSDHVVGSWAELVVNEPAARDHPHFAEIAAFASFSAMRRGDMTVAALLRDTARNAIPDGTAGVHALVRVLDSEMIVTMAIDGAAAWARAGEERLTAARAAGDPYELTRAAASCAVAVAANGGDARELGREALELGRRLGNPTAWCGAAMSLGQATASYDPVAALELLDEAVRAGRDGGNDMLVDVANGVRAHVLYLLGDHTNGLPAMMESIDAQYRNGYVSYAISYLRFIAGVLAAAGQDASAAVLLGFWRAHGAESYDDTFGVDAALDSVPARLGTRFDALAAQGAAFTDVADAISFAKEAVKALVDLPAAANTPQHR
jgi:predicted ATPase/class 3 adenylate cyclase